MSNVSNCLHKVLVIGSSPERCDRYGQYLQAGSAISYRISAESCSFQSLSPEHLQYFDGILWVLDSPKPVGSEPITALASIPPDLIPPLVAVGNNEAESAVWALKQGATDYLACDRMTADDLCNAMRSAIENAQLKRALQVSQERFQTSIENLMDCFGIFTAIRDATGMIVDFRIDYLNESACTCNQMPRERQIGHRLCEVLPGHRTTGLFDDYCRLVETGEPVIRESIFYSDTYGGDREVGRVFDVRATRLDDGFVASWRDITDRRQMEQELSALVLELQREQSRLKRLINTAPIGIGIGNSKGEVKSLNDAMLRLHGYTRQEFEQQGMNWQDFIPPEGVAQAKRAMEVLQQQVRLPPQEKELVQRDGTRVPVWISATQWSDTTDEHVAFVVDLTPQKQVEAALRRSQQRYRDLAEAMPQMVWTADATGAVNYWNQRWYEYTGLSPVESMAVEGIQVVHPDERDRALARWEQAITHKEIFEIEYRLRRRDGIYCWFICRGLPTYDAQGHVLGWIGTITDINEQKQLHERFQLVMQAVNGLVFDWERQTNYIYRSEKLYELLGIHPQDARPDLDWWDERIHPDDRKRLQAHKQQFDTRNSTLQETEYRIRHRDGHWVDVWDRSCLVRDHDGQIVRIVGSMVDISDRKQAERALQTAHIQLQSALEAGSIYLWHWNLLDNRIVTNRRLAHLFGVDPEGAASGLPIELFLAAIDSRERPKVIAAIDQAIATGEAYQAEFRIHDAEGRERWVSARGRVEYDDSGRAIALPGAFADITERYQAELALQESQLQLQRQLVEIEAIYQSAPIGLSVLDRHRRFVRLNQRLAEINGLPIESHLGRTLHEILPTIAEALDPFLQMVLETGEPISNIEIQGETPAQPGVLRTWLRSFYPLKSGGQVIGINTVCEEITYRKQAEDALRQSEERYRTLFESMNEGFCVIKLIFDDQGRPVNYRFLETNPAFKQQTGLQNAEGQTIRQFLPDLNEDCLEHYSEVVRTGMPARFESYTSLVDRWFDISAFRIGQPDDYKIAVLFKDTTHRRRIESNLRDRQERLELATRAAGLGVFEWNFEHNALFWENQTMFNIFSRTETEGPFTYEEFMDSIIHPDDRDLFAHCLQEAQAPNKLFHAICRIRSSRTHTSDGQWHWIECNGRFELAADGAPQRLVGVVRDITDRILAQEELRQREVQFRTLADNISQFAWMTDKDGAVFWYNQRWLDFTGTTPEEMEGEGWRKVYHPDHVERVLQKFKRCIETGEIWEDTFPLQKHDGTYRWFLSRAIPIRDHEGRIFCWFGTNTDITLLRQTELALRQTSERLEIALRTAPITLFNQDLDLYYTWIYNPALDYSEKAILGRRDQDLFTPETVDCLTALKRRVIDTGITNRAEVEMQWLNGQISHYDLAIDPLRNEQGHIVGITCAAVDITDRKQTAAALAANEARLRGFVESNVVGILYGDIYGNIHKANDEFLEIVGYTREAFETDGLHWLDMTPTEYLEVDAGAIEEAQTRGACTPYEKEFFRKDGDRVPVLVGYSLVGEERVESVAFVLDLTDIKQAETQLEQLLQREQDARTEAERANRVKDEFLAILSHELRTPLNPILGWSRLLQTRKLDEEKVAQALATIERNAKLQTQLIDDLLDVARILRGKLKLDPAPVNLAEVVEAAMDTVRHAAHGKSIELCFSPCATPSLVVYGDAGRLQQIIWNLLSNAIKFTPNDGRVDIDLLQQGNQAQILVKDTGKGISPDFLPYLFESFRQEDISITRQFGGLGLGLAIVRYLVEAHGGTVVASSPGEGQGSTFIVSLPLLHGGTEDALFSGDSSAISNLSRLKVLAVDDDADTCELLSTALMQYGATVETAYSADEAMKLLEEKPFTLLISDIGMPDTDGYAFIQQVRRLPSREGGDIPAIALTAYSRLDDRHQALSSGFQEHLAKPLDIEQLLQAVVAIVQNLPSPSQTTDR